MLLNHSALLRIATASIPDFPFIELAIGTQAAPKWRVVTYSTFHNHVQRAASYWHVQLSALGITPGDVVGLWFPGTLYIDVLQLMTIISMSCVPVIDMNKCAYTSSCTLLPLCFH
jgi:hypothetical protein